MILDLFAGPGGWDTGLRETGYTGPLLGIEWNTHACNTARAAGHDRLQADVATLHPADFGPVTGLIASPPCQGFTNAGACRGVRDRPSIVDAIRSIRSRPDLDDAIYNINAGAADDRSALVLEPLRWALTLTPSWLAWEQVPAVLPVWEACAEVLRAFGYSVDTRIISAEQYGVPQVRRRAILVARSELETRRHGHATIPAATHSAYHQTEPDRLDPGVQRWVSVADVFDLDVDNRGPVPTVDHLDTSKARRAYLREQLDAGTWVPRAMSSVNSTSQTYAPRLVKYPAKATIGNPGVWCERTTMAQGRNDPDPHHAWRTVAERSVLNTFPADYPWQGGPTAVNQQLGDVVPPLLARVLLAPLVHPATTQADRIAA